MTVLKQGQQETEVLDTKLLEMYSSAYTLSDMEIFVFPDLLYALVLANIMSPVIWEWRSDPWFKGMEKRSFMQRINRVKQFIMDNFVFNLDLETWGLTTQENELKRFSSYMDEETIAGSNALFGYEGDKYYFDIDIRKHFGLDRYNGNVIPYWKTETAEAMKAFNYKKDYTTGAGECVSLSTLYAAALFIIAKIPLEKIYLLATPLHSQNYIDEKQGVLTNNRRIVTKNMWCNGTTISTKARRALENEEVTIVSHASGYIHTVYTKATIDPEKYSRFKKSLSAFLTADMKPEIISSFLRRENRFQCCFQYCHIMHGKKMYIKVERIYTYEHSSPNSFSTNSRSALLKEIDAEEFSFTPFSDRIVLNEMEDYIKNHPALSINDLDKMMNDLYLKKCQKIDEMFRYLKDFLYIEPRLPGTDKEFTDTGGISIPLTSTREDIVNMIKSEARENNLAHLALFAYRDMESVPWEPFLKAAVERNPVSIEWFAQKDMDDVIVEIRSMINESIYDNKRLAMPDEVWNYGRGDGIEKAVLLANIIKNRDPESEVVIKIDDGSVEIKSEEIRAEFESSKEISCSITL